MIEAGDATERLAAAVSAGDAHTVRVCFSDHYGTLRGRRLPAEVFLRDPATRQGFCDGALVWDVECEIFEATRYSNFSTGYPDLYADPDLGTLRPCGWSPGEWSVLCDVVDAHGAPVLVDPRQALRGVLARADVEVTVRACLELNAADVSGWAPGAPAGWGRALADGLYATGLDAVAVQPDADSGCVRVHLGAMAPLALADALATTRTAAREIGVQHGAQVNATAKTTTDRPPARLALQLEWAGTLAPGVPARAHELSLLLAPLPLGYPRPAAALRPDGTIAIDAASDANPWLALAAALAACAASADSQASPPEHYRRAADRLRHCAWAPEWFDPLLLHDTLALADREADLRERRVTAWDLERYADVG